MTETKLEGNGEVSWCGVNGIIAGVQEMERAGHPVEQFVAQCSDTLDALAVKSSGIKFSRFKVCVRGARPPMKARVKKGT